MLYFHVHKSGKLVVAAPKHENWLYTLQWPECHWVHFSAVFYLDHYVEINPVSTFKPLVTQCQQVTSTVITEVRKTLYIL